MRPSEHHRRRMREWQYNRKYVKRQRDAGRYGRTMYEQCLQLFRRPKRLYLPREKRREIAALKERSDGKA